MNSDQYVKGIMDLFKSNANPDMAKPMKAYMKYQFDFYGIKAPDRRLLQKKYLKENGLPQTDQLEDVIKIIYNQPYRELQHFGSEIVEKMIKKLDAEFVQTIEMMIITKSWWDTVDFIASNITGKFFLKYPSFVPSQSSKWNQAVNMWLNRSSILFQLKYKDRTDTKLLSKYIIRHAASKEFFLQKAIGWVLREYGKTDPEWVTSFVDSHSLMPLSRREALRNIR